MLPMTQATPEPQTPDWTLGWRLKRALDWGKVSAQEMAEELGVHPGTVSRWMNDREVPRRAFLRVWALRCGVPIDWLSGEEHSPHNPGQLCSQGVNLAESPPSTREIASLAKPINELIPLSRATQHRSAARRADR